MARLLLTQLLSLALKSGANRIEFSVHSALQGTQVISGNQWQSVAISGNQWQSAPPAAIRVIRPLSAAGHSGGLGGAKGEGMEVRVDRVDWEVAMEVG